MIPRACIIALACLCTLPAWAARSFNGSNQSIVASTAVADVPMTFACYFKPSGLTGTAILVGIFATNDDGHYLIFRGATGGDPLGAVSNDQGVANGEASTGTSSIAAGTWYHGAAVYTSSTSRAVFLNGAKFTNSTSATPSGFGKTSIGVFAGASDISFFAGDIAEVGIWNVALDDENITALAAGFPPIAVRPTALVFYVPLWREVFDYVGRVTLTNNSTTEANDHPRIYR
jgi:hypothetical protein